MIQKERIRLLHDQSISFCVIQSGAGSCPWPPHPGEPVPSVPPIGEADETSLRYGGFQAASCTRHKDYIFRDAFTIKQKIDKLSDFAY